MQLKGQEDCSSDRTEKPWKRNADMNSGGPQIQLSDCLVAMVAVLEIAAEEPSAEP